MLKINKETINLQQTLECGQVFSYKKTAFGFCIYSADRLAIAIEHADYYEILTPNPEYFAHYFDLETDYTTIKNRLKSTLPASTSTQKLLETAINFGAGIRILRQNPLETLVSFCVSANNNIKRITASLFALRENYGEFVAVSEGFAFKVFCILTKLYIKNNPQACQKSALEWAMSELAVGGFVKKGVKFGFFAFPSLAQLTKITEADFRAMGLGYRAPQIVKLIAQLDDLAGKTDNELDIFSELASLSTANLRSRLIEFSGVGPKVADCVMLFGFGRGDVFPVDTWIAKVFRAYFGDETDRVKMRRRLVELFGDLSGYAQQFLFYFAREN